jgi:hypothetical protein
MKNYKNWKNQIVEIKIMSWKERWQVWEMILISANTEFSKNTKLINQPIDTM